nr:hypothetical protein BaRGS_024803 [Batillaria attramentaria]
MVVVVMMMVMMMMMMMVVVVVVVVVVMMMMMMMMVVVVVVVVVVVLLLLMTVMMTVMMMMMMKKKKKKMIMMMMMAKAMLRITMILLCRVTGVPMDLTDFHGAKRMNKFELGKTETNLHFGNRLREVGGEDAAIMISPVHVGDVGLYGVKFKVQAKDESGTEIPQTHTASAYLNVGAVPPPREDRDDNEDESYDDDSDNDDDDDDDNEDIEKGKVMKMHVVMMVKTIKTKVKAMIPKVKVMTMTRVKVMMTEVHSSSGYADNQFYLDLPRNALPGDYRARVVMKPHLLRCVPEDSPLRRTVVVRINREVTSWETCGGWEQKQVDEKQETEAANVTRLREAMERLQQQWNATRQAREDRLEDVTQLQKRVDELVHDVRIVENVTSRLDNLEDELNTLTGEPKTAVPDPLLKDLTEAYAIQAPATDDTGTTLRSLVLTDDGIFVAGNHEKNELFIASSHDRSQKRPHTLQHGNNVQSVALLPGGRIAVTVDTNHIMVADVSDVDSALGETWLDTERAYSGSVARSEDTLFVGARPDSYSGARVDIVSLTGDQAECPDSLTLHGNDLYISDWCSNSIIVLHLDTSKFDVLGGPPYHADLMFYEPRMTAFDDLGNMFLATGGTVCGYQKDGHYYSRGFCVVLITRDGGFKKVLEEGKDIYPYGVISTNSGIAVTWVDFTTFPHRSSIKGYTLQGTDH